MALIRRFSRLITADVHAVLDQLEEPEIVLKQAIREMEEELARQTQHGGWLDRELEATRGRAGELDRRIRELDEKLDLCFANDSDELARRLVRRKLEAEKGAERLRARCTELEAERDEHTAALTADRDRLEGMREKAALLGTERSFAGREPVDRAGDIDDAEVELAFMRERQARAQS